jgi:hypothetical protein
MPPTPAYAQVPRLRTTPLSARATAVGSMVPVARPATRASTAAETPSCLRVVRMGLDSNGLIPRGGMSTGRT